MARATAPVSDGLVRLVDGGPGGGRWLAVQVQASGPDDAGRLHGYHARALMIAAARPRVIRMAVRGAWGAGRRGWCRC
jgi:hypothetical protein